MNRIRISNNPQTTTSTLQLQVKESLKVIHNAHSSNEKIIEKLFTASQNEQQLRLRNALQKDMQLINDQLEKMIKNFEEK